MALSAGAKLGPYLVLAPLGAGGMGEVYRARDTRLDRDVAIKVLPAHRMADAARRHRFAQEARAASALNHPNIVTIHEIESAGDVDFIVMEYVPGKSLDALIPRQGMRLGEVLRTAIPIADALAKAHARGIVHRDLKPANIVIGSDGVAKLLDFGLAKLLTRWDPAPDDATADTEDGDRETLTRPGMAAGTIAYMSPEQASGRPVDARSDVFSFGATLYEMVTGRRAFSGSSSAETLAAVMKEQPKPPSDVVPEVPRDLDKLIQRCLRKDPDRRFQHMADVKLDLEQIKEDSESAPVAASMSLRRRPSFLWLALALAVVAAGVAVVRPPAPGRLPPPRVTPLATMSGKMLDVTFSPDGSQVAFAWEGDPPTGGREPDFDIYLKMVGSSETRQITKGPAADSSPSWSPDGRQIAFLRATPEGVRIFMVSPLGGVERKVGDFPANLRQLSWTPDGAFVAAARMRGEGETAPEAGGIHLVPALGGEARAVTAPASPRQDTCPALSPDGRQLAYLSCPDAALHACRVQVVALTKEGAAQGPPRTLTRGIMASGLAWTRDGGSLVYGDGSWGGIWRLPVGGDQPPERIEIAGLRASGPASVSTQDRLAFRNDRYDSDLYSFEEGRPAQAVAASSLPDYNPSFSPDGRRIAYTSFRSGARDEIWVADANGANPTQLTRGPGLWQGSPRFSPDGRRIAFDSMDDEGHWDIWTVAVDGGSPQRLTREPGDENMPSFSRDGRFVYYRSKGDGRPDIWRVPSGGGVPQRMTFHGGDLAYESTDGQTLYYSSGTFADSPLYALPLGGGKERQVVDCVEGFSFAVSRRGVHYVGCEPDGTGRPLYLLDGAGRSRLVGKLEGAARYSLIAASPDGKALLYTRVVVEGAGLMMIEGFH